MVTRSILRPVLRPVTRAVSDTIRGFNPRSLFAAGEQGALYDLYDQSTLFQDAAGTTPWTTLGQPLGLQLDKSKGGGRGPELSPNGGTFDDAAGWTITQPTSSISGGVLNVGAGACDIFPSTASVVAGKSYEVTFTISNSTANYGIRILNRDIITTGNHFPAGAPYITANGSYRFVCVAISNGSIGVNRVSGHTGSLQVDNFSVKEIPGNHRYQTTPTSRPTIEARVNALLSTADLSTSSWQLIGGTRTPGQTDPLGGTTGTRFAGPSIGIPASNHPITARSTTAKFTVYAKYVSGATTDRIFLLLNATTATIFDVLIVNLQTGAIVYGTGWTVTAAGNGYYKLEYTRTTGISVGDNLTVYIGATSVLSDSDPWDVAFPQLAFGDDIGYGYQRVTTATDYADIGAPRRIKYDGIDDFLQTASVDFSATDKMTVWAGVRKLSDAAIVVVVELSTNSDSTNGTFSLAASVAGDGYWAQSRGTVRSTKDATGYVAPHSAVLVAEAKISTDILRLHVNNAAPLSSAADQGTGNYGNYPIYFGARAGTSLRFSGEVFSPEVIRGAESTAAQIDMVERVINRNMGGVY